MNDLKQLSIYSKIIEYIYTVCDKFRMTKIVNYDLSHKKLVWKIGRLLTNIKMSFVIVLMLISITSFSQIPSVGGYVPYITTEGNGLLNNILVYYPMEETSGTTCYDATVNGNDGTITGCTLNGEYYEFNGSSDYVNTGLTNSLTDFTISAWANIDLKNYGDIFGREKYLTIVTYLSGQILCNVGNGSSWGAHAVGVSGTLSDLTWHNIIVTRNSGLLTLYVDGISVGTSTNLYSLNLTNVLIGYREGTGYALDGFIRDFAIWDITISQTQIGLLADGLTFNDFTN
jgi:hypothetical protein